MLLGGMHALQQIFPLVGVFFLILNKAREHRKNMLFKVSSNGDNNLTHLPNAVNGLIIQFQVAQHSVHIQHHHACGIVETTHRQVQSGAQLLELCAWPRL